MNYNYMAILAMLMLVSSPALAQSGARRNTTVTERQEAKAERKQTKVDEVQKPTNIANQSATDDKLRNPGGTSSDRRNGSNDDRNSGNGGAVNNNGGYNGNSGGNSGGNYNGNGNSGKNNGGYNGGNSGGNRPPVNNGGNNGGYGNGNRPSGNNGGYSNGNRPPVNGGNYGGNRPPAGYGGNYGGYNGNDRPPVNNGSYGKYPGGYNDIYPGVRPPLPTIRNYTSSEIVYRTNSSSIVLRTPFRSKEEAYRYVERLLDNNMYTVGTYGNGYSWLQSEVSFIPTPFDWTNPMTHNQFRIKVNFYKSFGYIRVAISGEWRESILSSSYSALRFQPSDSYSTYYAWNVLEDLADSIPHDTLSYR